MKIVSQYVWVPEHLSSGPDGRGPAGSGIAEHIERYRPNNARLVNLVPAGSDFSPGTFFVVWEVES